MSQPSNPKVCKTLMAPYISALDVVDFCTYCIYGVYSGCMVACLPAAFAAGYSNIRAVLKLQRLHTHLSSHLHLYLLLWNLDSCTPGEHD
ncbi:predicted protein [Pyrenophora tritici-repentis Pt-1C-BFP]|uniref:Uncharacterized protein n=1 Tax=Pyrenophora tritici-repentis (strain Pt-1C-BFP) TaxID=426418 RepID=B2VVC1_PYRTR|nr:uncharacterized protein PTRG_01188 [Pyrenophora tritici-repentis Pt-1C-BFP]EDU40626.1 predicted protein [Pyrenophora tritici-repentis Pt-1C-BFP]